MAFTYGFYNSKNMDRVYNAIQMSQIFDGLISDGIYATFGQAMIVSESTKVGKVIIGSGRAWFNHTWSYNDSPLEFSVPQSNLLLKRIDALVLDINSNDDYRENKFLWVLGEASDNPERPTLINVTDHHQYPLCYVLRNPDTEKVNQADITNMVGRSECPFVTGIIETINTDDLITQWEAEWDNWSEEMQTEILTWYAGVKDLLDDNVAINLQNQITALSNRLTNSYYTKTSIDNMVNVAYRVLPAGSTSIQISPADLIGVNSSLSFYTSIYGVNPKTVTINGPDLVTLTFDAQATAMEVGVEVNNKRIDGSPE